MGAAATTWITRLLEKQIVENQRMDAQYLALMREEDEEIRKLIQEVRVAHSHERTQLVTLAKRCARRCYFRRALPQAEADA